MLASKPSERFLIANWTMPMSAFEQFHESVSNNKQKSGYSPTFVENTNGFNTLKRIQQNFHFLEEELNSFHG